MSKKEIKMELPKVMLGDLFTTQEERDDAKLEKVKNINIDEIDDFPNHPFKVIVNDDMKSMVDSIKENGVLVPTLVRPKDNGRYEMISGHRRKFASQYANLDTIPCIVRDLTDDEATIIMVDSNLQREKLLPSEKAFAYKMKLDALKHQGKRSDLTCAPVGHKLEFQKARDILSEELNESREQIRRYIRLTNLIPKILEMVDDEKIAFRPAVELSYLSREEQESLLDCIEYNECTPSLSQAIELKKLSLSNKLDVDKIDEIMLKDKPNQITKIKFDERKIRNVLPKNIEEKKIEDFVVKSIEFYSKYLRQKQKDAR
ncbi:MAG: ParB/RepB/Spo0J family partition protein [Bacilli bacterium]|nr:ParB/RepB/Spo0J family partition protein [Bacilli bacterium]